MLDKFVSHKTLANILMLVFIGIGIYALPNLRRETFPEFTASEIQISIAYPGASAEEIEESICQKVEDAVDGISYVKEVRSVAQESVGTITVEVEDGASVTAVQSDIETEVDAINDFPDAVEDPVITQLGLTDMVLTLAVTGPMSPADLKDYCEDLKRRLKTLDEVSLVDVQGFSDRQLRVDLDNEALRRLGLTASQVAQTIGAQSVDTPAGTIESRNDDILVRFVEKRRTAREIEDIILTGVEGQAEIRVKDVARVIDTFENPEVQSWLDGERAGILQIEKTRSQDTTQVASAIKEYLEDEKLRHPQLRYEINNDSSTLINDRFMLLLKNTWQGILLVFFTMWFFFNIRISFWVVMSLPVSFLGAFYFMPMAGQTINMMTMVAMLLAVGLLMDDGIVIAENIARHLSMGKKSMRAAVDGVKEVGGGVISSFLTTICVLGPLASLSGTIGKVLQVIPIVLLMVMAVSLVEAFLILPAHLGHSLHGHDPEKVGFIRRRIDGAVDWVRESIFGRIIDWAVSWRYLVVGLCVGAFILSIGMMSAGFVGFQAFPETEGDTLQARILLVQGTPLRKTEQVATQISEAMNRVNEHFADQPDDQDLVQSIIVEFNKNADAFESGPHVATVTARLLAPENRNTGIDDIKSRWRQEVGNIPDILGITYGEPSFGPAGRPIEVKFTGHDLRQAKAAAQKALTWFSQFTGVFDLNDDLRFGKREIRIKLKEGAVGLGFNVQSMADQVRTAFQGAKADDVQVGAEQFEINVRFGPDFRNSIQDFEDFHFIMSDGTQVPIDTVADITFSRGWSRIARIDGQRTVTLIGDTDSNLVNTSSLTREFGSQIEDLERDFPGVKISLGGESEESQDTSSSMILAFALGLFGVYVILSFQFESWLEPVIVMFAIPMALIGVIWGHYGFGLDLSMPSMIGFISLSGVVVNDSILLILFLKQQRQEGQPAEKSACAASRIRFRAIILTSATTVAGLLPLTLEQSSQAQTLVPLAVSIAFGMMASTILILIVIPCIYVVLVDLHLIRDEKDEH